MRFLYSHGCFFLNVSRFFTERIVGGDLLTLFTRRRFCSLPVGHNIGILEFFGADLHLDFCTRGCPTPLSASHRATSLTSLSLAGLRCSARRCKRKTSAVPSHTYKLRVQSSLKSSLAPPTSVTNVKQKRRWASSEPYSSRCMWTTIWGSQSGFHPQCPTLCWNTMDWVQACDF